MDASTMTKEQWVEVFRAAGLDDAQMKRWHREFEQRYPDQHRGFLGWLQISSEEIVRIREASRS